MEEVPRGLEVVAERDLFRVSQPHDVALEMAEEPPNQAMPAHENSPAAGIPFEPKGLFQVILKPNPLQRNAVMKETASAVLPKDLENGIPMIVVLELREDFKDARAEELGRLPARRISSAEKDRERFEIRQREKGRRSRRACDRRRSRS